MRIGVKTMLIQNKWVELGLVNGIIGIFKYIIWKEGVDIKKDPFQALFITINQYNKFALFTWQNNKKNCFYLFYFCK